MLPEEIQRIQWALDQLSPEHRVVLVLKEIEGMKVETIAEQLLIPLDKVRTRLHQARLELREILEKDHR
jgi:RNA polymerase sigma-70 factor (ECF subfamily)